MMCIHNSALSTPKRQLFYSGPNATLQVPPIAGATEERRLLAVACKRLFGPHRGLGPWETVHDTLASLASAYLLDHFVRQNQEGRGYRDPEGLRGLEVDDKRKLRGLLDRQVSRRGALQDLGHVGGGVPVHVRSVRAVGHQAACLDPHPGWEHRRQPVLRRQGDDTVAVEAEQRGPQDHEGFGSFLGGGRKGAGVIVGRRVAQLERLELHSEHLCRPFRCAELVGGNRVPEHGYAGDLGEGFLEEFEAFAGDLDLLEEQTRNLPAWPRQPRNVP